MSAGSPEALRGVLGWLCPPRCAACDGPLGPGEALFCAPCGVSLQRLEGRRCPRCGARVEGGACRECRRTPPAFRSATAVFAYGGALAQVIQRFKYGGRLDLARPLGALLAPVLEGLGVLVVPIPSSPAALRRRGFDPVMEILRALAVVPWAPLLVRVDRRPAQAGLPAEARRALGVDAFRIRGAARPRRERLCLLDDVFTTGATVRAAAAALVGWGAGVVDAIALARSETQLSDDSPRSS